MASGGVDVYRHRILTEVAGEIGETCNLTVPEGSQILYVDRVEAEWPFGVQLPVGSRVPLHCTASGELYLGSLPESRRRKLLNSLPLDVYTLQTITNRETLSAEIEAIRRDKVGLDNEEFVAGMVAAAVSIMDGRGCTAAMLAVHAPVIRMDMAKLRAQIPLLRRAAKRISADIAN